MKNIEYYYPNYAVTARQRLEACKYLVAKCDSWSNQQEEFRVCHEIYYLCGYILEALCIFTIYKSRNWIKSKPIHSYDKDFSEETDLSYGGENTTYNIQGHRFQLYVEILRNDPNFEDIPYFGTRSIGDGTIEDLIANWSPKIRYNYQDKDGINMKNIKKIIDVCEKIYAAVNMNIGLN